MIHQLILNAPFSYNMGMSSYLISHVVANLLETVERHR